MHTKEKVAALSTATVLALAFLLPIMAVHANGSFNAGSVPKGSTLVVNITFKVINDEDSGFFGYWALDNYNRHVQVWQMPTSGMFYIVSDYIGKFTTFAGALSPMNGVIESSGAEGHLSGAYTATVSDGVLNPGVQNGNLGTKDFGGTSADILLGTYGAGQTGPTTPFSWFSYVFSAGAFAYNDAGCGSGTSWTFAYSYHSQTWVNAGCGSSGDIVT
jgi:hypothetical protein